MVSTLLVVLGWSGAALSLTAYAMVTHRRLAPDSVTYQLMNVCGSTALAVSATANEAWPSAAVSVIWVLIGVQAVLMARRHVIRAGLVARLPWLARLVRAARRIAGRARRGARAAMLRAGHLALRQRSGRAASDECSPAPRQWDLAAGQSPG